MVCLFIYLFIYFIGSSVFVWFLVIFEQHVFGLTLANK
jgi:hypothetical protein